MENFLQACDSFMKFLLYKGRGEFRSNFPRKQAMIFAAEVVEVWNEVARYWARDDTNISRCSRLSFALTILAESCNEKHGIAAYCEVVEVIVELCAQIQQQNESINAIMNQIHICPATIATLTLEPGNMNMSEGATAGYPASATEVAAAAIDETSPNPLIYRFESLQSTNVGHEVLGRKLELIRHMITKGALKFVQSVQRRVRSDQEIILLFHTESNLADLSTELDSLKSFLSGFQVNTEIYIPPIEL